LRGIAERALPDMPPRRPSRRRPVRDSMTRLARGRSRIRSFKPELEEYPMLKWALIFFLISIVAGVFGFTGIAAGAASIAKILFFLFLLVAIAIIVFAIIAGKALF
jgi:uncharacterized membrane protein YtjA (UPF0391 family)